MAPSWNGAKFPIPKILHGQYGRLEPLNIAKHKNDLYQAYHSDSSDIDIWDYTPYGPFKNQAQQDVWLAQFAAGDDIVCAVIDLETEKAIGIAGFTNIKPEFGTVSLGHIIFSKAMQRRTLATETLYLLAREVFDNGFRRLEWRSDAQNVKSRRSAERAGFTEEGTLRQHMMIKGHNQDTVIYSIIDREWDGIAKAFDLWLDPTNFDEHGTKKKRLEEYRSGSSATS
eukprot:Gregarina_sp_Poly_1__742@NODE_1178_length_4857_cov_128_051148_g808_i0_p2_GENE_NODE_1178_length_4857_cov_128_051148_g808_i0NODE_1178_length_4857_cov_128_051148_g808_i0_p2_ORF_typecomplete_len227_score33_16Acetyltransf_3/PF13302_7/5_2e18Acetyltransf_4/PF13420_7/6_4e10GNAT_acetyltran/PF12746_7/5_2e06Acetyltransf_1/PF00583_25/2_8e05Acetyltransf_8/PF13523_6/0_0028_NODE_1178_length_4857_cov_128_051148_g808_i0292972